MLNPTIRITCYKNRLNEKGEARVVFRLKYGKQMKTYPIDRIYLKPDDLPLILCDPIKTPRGMKKVEALALARSLNNAKSDAERILQSLPKFAFDKFDNIYLKNLGADDSVKAIFTRKIDSLKSENRISTAVQYEQTLKKLEEFSANRNLTFASIDVDYLKRLEKWMLNRSVGSGGFKTMTETTIGMYLRTLRAIYNEEINAGRIIKELYPFGRGKFQIPKGAKKKRALTIDDIQKIIDYRTSGEFEERSRDFWLMSYFFNGMNFTDLLRLRWCDIDLTSDKIEFERQKTRETKQTKEKITIYLNKLSKGLLLKYAIKSVNINAFVFPYLQGCQTEIAKYKATQQFIKLTNNYMKMIGVQLSFPIVVTTYCARHSYSSILMRSNVPIAYISQSLGHSDIRTTQAYLGSFESEQAKRYISALLPEKLLKQA